MSDRRLAAILSADVVGYSSLMEHHEAATLAALKRRRNEIINPRLETAGGRVVKLMGDGELIEFPSIVEAVEFAADVQTTLAALELEDGEPPIAFRIGVHLGDIMIEDDDIYGDGVNIASRIEALADPGGVCISRQAYDQVETKLELAFESIGEQRLKNLARPIEVFRVVLNGEVGARRVPRFMPKRAATTSRQPLLLGAMLAAAILVLVGLGAALYSLVGDGSDQPTVMAQTDARPSLAVLPLLNLSNDPDQEYFADGITDDLITDLSQVSGLLVMARHSTFAYKGQARDVREIARELNVGHVLEGSIRKIGDRFRINVKLIDAKSGSNKWAARYDRRLEEIFAFQDEVTRKVVDAMSVQLTSSESKRLDKPPEARIDAYDIFLRGIERLQRFTRETNKEAREFFVETGRLDPSFARAHADVALTHAMDLFFGWSESRETSITEGERYLRKALIADDSIRQVHFATSNFYLSQGRHDKALRAIDRALQIDPNYADGFAQKAQILALSGQPEKSLVAIAAAKKLSPHYPFYFAWIESLAHFVAARYQDVVRIGEHVTKQNPHFPGAHLTLASAYWHVGRTDDAEWELIEVQNLIPDFDIKREKSRMPFKRSDDLKRYLDGLRGAGAPLGG